MTDTTTLSDELSWRGFINQTTFDDLTRLDGEKMTFYFGVDPSADGMTIGNLAAAMMVRQFMEYGHNAVLLVGGATGMIGDPDGKKDERSLKTIEEIEHNKQAIVAEYRRVFAGKEFEVVDNYDWFKDINYLTFLREIGKHVPLSQMLGRDFVQARLGEGGSGISYAEFSYSLIQGYDFLKLYKDKGVTLQLCGADQWGNAIAGVDLIRRIAGGEAHVFSTPLVVNKATGRKFGKSEEGAVWLNYDKTSVYKFYQFWLNADDEGVIDYIKIYTLLPKDQVDDIEQQQAANPGARAAQRALAYEVTKLVHGEDGADSAKRVTEVLFGSTAFSELSSQDIDVLASEILTVSKGAAVVDVLVENGIATSRGEARRLIQGGAISINSQKITDDQIINEPALIKKGKNSFLLVR